MDSHFTGEIDNKTNGSKEHLFCWELYSKAKELYTKDQETHTRMSLMLEHSGRLPDNLCFMNHDKSHKNSMCM